MPVANVTIGFEPDMLVNIDDHADANNMSRAEYVRHCVRQAHDTPFEEPDTVLCKDENHADGGQKEGAA